MKLDDGASRAERVEQWECGVALSAAWSRFGAAHQREQQRQRRGTPASSHLVSLMTDDLLTRVRDGELVAFGYRVMPTVSDGPVEIPRDLFEAKQDEQDILQDTFAASGWRYERVMVIDLAQVCRHEDETKNDATVPQSSPTSKDIKSARRGPKSGADELRRIYQLLRAGGTIPPNHTLKEAHKSVVEFLERSSTSPFSNGRGLSYKSFARAMLNRSGT